MSITRWLSSLIWLVPLAAAVVGLALALKALNSKGPGITIAFASAEGLEAGKTRVRYRNVNVGSVEAIRLSNDHSRVLVDVRLTADAKEFVVADTRFWVVRPRVGAAGVSGLETILSGAYIGVDPGRSHETSARFTGLETPPAVANDDAGRRYVLRGESLGSADIGSPVYYRHVRAGRVLGYAIDTDGTGVTLDVFVNAPYDQYVGTATRWWHASGVDLRLDSNGVKLNTQSFATVMTGGLAFETPPRQASRDPAPDGRSFLLANDEASAMREPEGPPAPVVMKFTQSVRGLAVGAPVDFRGVELGYVTAIDVEYDARRRAFTVPVTVTLFPDRLGRSYRQSIRPGDAAAGKALLRKMVADGLRGQLRTGNLVTSQLYVALDMFPGAPRVSIDTDRSPLELPTVPNTLDELQAQIADIAKKLDRVPFDETSRNLNNALESASNLFEQLDTQVVPEARETLAAARETFSAAQTTLHPRSPLMGNMHEALAQLTLTLQTLKQLADHLQLRPESLLYGKRQEPQP
ncbi:PqiB family protein [Paraburkholderia kururiensis]|uniref:PqiB family protein n=1 Tax=Paraburkholderia kururiensis TaxID=984307 RepID=UPI0005AAE16C|nr:MlaD family protein [Paraburkholderia kururiensis]